MKYSTNKKALDPIGDAEKIQELKLCAIHHRKKLLELGKDLSIRLHYGAATSSVEILTTLYKVWMTYKPEEPQWNDRDRFVLSKGHAAPSLYITLSSCGFFPDSEFKNFRRLHSMLQGHPDRKKTPGVDCSTGSLGQGFSVAAGMALGGKADNASYKVYVLMSDGECNEGSIWEAALISANYKLDNFIVLLDWNKKSSYGEMKGRNDVVPLDKKWEAFGWNIIMCDGHDFISLTQALENAENAKDQPSILLCNTVKGKGIPYVENNRTPSNFMLSDKQYTEAMVYLKTLEVEICL